MKILNAITITGISLSSLVLSPLLTLAQTRTNTPAPANTAAISNDWKNFANIETGFMQGCMGTQVLPAAQKKIKQDFCQCAFASYKNRYTPQVFIQMNALAVKIGQDGPALVSVMMKPELDFCFAKTGYRP